MKNYKTTIIMKKLFKTFALIALTATATFANENKENKASNFEVGMYSLNGTAKVRLLLEKEKGANLVVSLKNDKGEVLFKEFLGKNSTGYNKYFNLDELANGTYELVIDNGSEVITKKKVRKETTYETSVSVEIQ
jgi:hypothetical protein